jgi:hypothetical protein
MLTEVTNPLIFGVCSVLVVGYLLYITLRKRKGLRSDHVEREPDL